ncbi:hypothetical protein EIN_503630 [Entamoeba invadens IP1]|uniref:Uncharacterized protein n=1 Tax=Entamoeba invadens IP1 TaxID=370355 RepID=A0A0A1U793_ENTIV|nr:hypothetical protein EIN_503630 [Entamoeba invadens IP1]ELP90277.1 hypothetical protein EIN_503630 [Entamoeba invadens IP1]|eukprot:XP_004257048.1 hypothetical protein EIN_503630 [Entamoeba invadens IP1]
MLFVLLLLVVYSNAVTVNGNWVSKVYRVREKVQSLDARYSELLDQVRHVSDQLDHARMDYENCIPEAKQGIAAKVKEMEEIVAISNLNANKVLATMKRMLNKLPSDLRERVIRDIHVEKYFSPVNELIHRTVHPAKK